MKVLNKELFKTIYNEIKINSKISQKQLSTKYNVCERTIRRYIKILKDNGYIKYIVNGKDKRWYILK